MNFQSLGRPFGDHDLDEACQILGVTESEVWAVLSVETRGFGFLSDRRPQILFERHHFRRLTGGRFDRDHPDISNRKPGGYAGGPAEYGRLEKAMERDRKAALQSVSWGIGQVMGFNFKAAGFASPESMAKAMVRGEREQLLAMASFVKANGLDVPMARHNWVAFARGYNGPDFKKNEYDTRLAAAHAKFSVILPDLGLRTAQAALLYLGYDPGPVDGLRGRLTRAALVSYQEERQLTATGDLGEETEERLLAEAFPQ
jgi:hypothetical protein